MMTILIIGVVLWIAPHFFKRLMPEMRASLGDRGKGIIEILLLISLILMVIGYRSADFQTVYTPIAGMGHLNNVLMLIAVFFASRRSKNSLLVSCRRPSVLPSAP